MIEVLCEDCREAFPSNQTRVITVSRVSSRRQTTRLYRGTRGGIGFGGSSGTTTSYRDRTICLDCLHYRAEELRRANRRRAFGWLFAIILGIGFFAWASQHRVFTPSQNASSVVGYGDDGASNFSSSDAAITPPPEVVNAPTDTETLSDADNFAIAVDDPSDRRSTDTADSAPPAIANEPVSSSQGDQNRQGTREIDEAIDDATRIALRTGKTARWHKNGQKGFVLVSEPTGTGDGICRSVAWTDNNSRSDTVIWCQTGGDWSPKR